MAIGIPKLQIHQVLSKPLPLQHPSPPRPCIVLALPSCSLLRLERPPSLHRRATTGTTQTPLVTQATLLPYNPARGPRGPPWPCPRRRHLSPPKERVESRPAADPCRIVCFTVFSASSIFPGLWFKMGQPWPNIGPNNAGNACRTGVLRLHRGRLLFHPVPYPGLGSSELHV